MAELTDIREAGRVRVAAGARATPAIIRARKPDSPACCEGDALASCCAPTAKDDCCPPEAAGGAPATCGCTG